MLVHRRHYGRCMIAAVITVFGAHLRCRQARCRKRRGHGLQTALAYLTASARNSKPHVRLISIDRAAQ